MCILSACFERLTKSYPLHVYVEVSKNHGYTLGEVMRHKFHPEIRLLIMYYNHKFLSEQREYEKMEKEREEYENKIQTTTTTNV